MCDTLHMSCVNSICHITCQVLHDIFSPKLVKLGSRNFETMFTTPCVSRVTCHMSHVTCHMSCFMCQMSDVYFLLSYKTLLFIFLRQICGPSYCSVCYQQGLPSLVYKVNGVGATFITDNSPTGSPISKNFVTNDMWHWTHADLQMSFSLHNKIFRLTIFTPRSAWFWQHRICDNAV